MCMRAVRLPHLLLQGRLGSRNLGGQGRLPALTRPTPGSQGLEAQQDSWRRASRQSRAAQAGVHDLPVIVPQPPQQAGLGKAGVLPALELLADLLEGLHSWGR